MFSVCDGKTGIGAGDNDIAVANYLNAEIITNYLNASHDTPQQDHAANTAIDPSRNVSLCQVFAKVGQRMGRLPAAFFKLQSLRSPTRGSQIKGRG